MKIAFTMLLVTLMLTAGIPPLLTLFPAAYAQIPDLDTSYAISATTQTVYVYCLPTGDGDALNDCRLLDGSRVDATITITVLDSNFEPVPYFPAEDLEIRYNDPPPWPICVGGTIADDFTDVNGQSTFSGRFYSGGHGQGATIYISGAPIVQPPFENYFFFSPDINGDLIVDLTDVVTFAQDYFGEYNYRSDFSWDGELNLADVVLFAQALGIECP